MMEKNYNIEKVNIISTGEKAKLITLLYYNNINNLLNFHINNEEKTIQVLEDLSTVLININPNLKRNNLNSDCKLLATGGYGQIFKLSDDFCIKINIGSKEYFHEYYIPIELVARDNTLEDMIIRPYSLIKNVALNGLLIKIRFFSIFVYLTYCYVFKKEYESKAMLAYMKNLKIDEIYKLCFKRDKRKTSIMYFNQLCEKVFTYEEYVNVLSCLVGLTKVYKRAKESTDGYIICMPLVYGISTEIFMNENMCLDREGRKAYYFIPQVYRILILQSMLFLLKARLYDKNFVHNDFKPDNILVSQATQSYSIKYKDLNFYFNENFRFRIADFDFSNLPSSTIKNRKIETSYLKHNTSIINDIHYLVHMLFIYIKEDERRADEVFFKKLHRIFIEPFCMLTYEQVLFNNKVVGENGEVICLDGILKKNANIKNPDELVANFINSNYFNTWRNKERMDKVVSHKHTQKYNSLISSYLSNESDISTLTDNNT